MICTRKIEVLTINVVSGIIKGLKLDSDKNDFLRPTKERIKKSVFDILGPEIYDKTFLDLFGGTGQIGVEAFSCGAKKVIIVESKKNHFNMIKKNISKIKVNHGIKIINCDALEFLRSNKTPIDIVFLDPPYGEYELLKNSLNMVDKCINKSGIIITETLSSQNIPNNLKNFSLKKQYKYGSIILSIYTSEDMP